jgi:hypothetical protein
LYATIPELGNGGPMSRKEFAEKYDFSCERLSPKRVKVLKDITLEEINKFLDLLLTRMAIVTSSQRILFLLRRWKGYGWWYTKRLMC